MTSLWELRIAPMMPAEIYRNSNLYEHAPYCYLPTDNQRLLFDTREMLSEALELLPVLEYMIFHNGALHELSPSMAESLEQLGRVPFSNFWQLQQATCAIGGLSMTGFDFVAQRQVFRVSYRIMPTNDWHIYRAVRQIVAVVERVSDAGAQLIDRIHLASYISSCGRLQRSAFTRDHGEIDELFRLNSRGCGLLMRIGDDITAIMVKLHQQATAPDTVQPFSRSMMPGSNFGKEFIKRLKASSADAGKLITTNSSINFKRIKALFGSVTLEAPDKHRFGCDGTLTNAWETLRDYSGRPGMQHALSENVAPELKKLGLACDCQLLKMIYTGQALVNLEQETVYFRRNTISDWSVINTSFHEGCSGFTGNASMPWCNSHAEALKIAELCSNDNVAVHTVRGRGGMLPRQSDAVTIVREGGKSPKSLTVATKRRKCS